MHNGMNIKKIRFNKGFTQAKVAKNILSQSTYSKFEAGQSDISSTSFVQILKSLDMTLEELLFINNDFNYECEQQLINRFFSLPYNDVFLLKNLLSDIKVHLQSNKSILLGDIYIICKALISLQTQKDIGLARKIVQPVWDRLSKLNQWYIVDIRIINTILYLFPNDTAIELTRNLLSRLEKYNGFQDTLRLRITFKINLSLMLIKDRDYNKALDILDETLIHHKKVMPYQSLAICFGRIAICRNKLEKQSAHTYLESAEQLLIIYEEMALWNKIEEEYRNYT